MTWMDDLRSALRSLRAARWTTLAAVVTLVLGTGANTAVLAVARGVLVRPLPFAQADRLVRISIVQQWDGGNVGGIALAEFDEWRQRVRAFDAIAAYMQSSFTVRGTGQPEDVRALLVDGPFFELLGSAPEAGHPFAAGQTGAVVLSDAFVRHLGATPAAVTEHDLSVGGRPYRVTAVMPPPFSFPDDDVRLWLPARSVGAAALFGQTDDARSYRLVARLRPGVTLAAARADANRVFASIHPNRGQGVVARVEPLSAVIVGDVRPVLVLFVVAAALLLLVACANVATLLVSRSLARTRELAVRLAIGASPARLVRATIAESLILAAAGSTAGALAAKAGVGVLVRLAGASLPRTGGIAVDWPVLAAAAGVALVVTALCGTAPALAAARADLAPVLRQTGAAGRRGGRRARAALVVVQVAVAIVLLVGAGLFGRTVYGLLRGGAGVRSDHALTMNVMLTESTTVDAPGREALADDVLARVRVLPGVAIAGFASALPPTHSGAQFSVHMISPKLGRHDIYLINLVAATPGYLQALGVRLIRGRWFNEADEHGSAPVVLMSELAARDLSWSPTADPVGQPLLFTLPSHTGKRVKPLVIGVVSDVRYAGLDVAAHGSLYVPWRQLPTGRPFLVVRTAGDPSAVIAEVTRAVHDVAPGMPLPNARTLDQEMNLAIAGRELRLWLVASFATLAFAVALVGLVAVLGRSVTERRRELAIRAALGATPRGAVALIARSGAGLTLAGVVVGVGAALGAGRWLAGLVYGVSAYDPITYAVVIGAVLGAAALASYLPARRAARIDPIELLRSE